MTGLDVLLTAALTYRLVILWQDDAILAPITDRLHQALDRRAARPGIGGSVAAWLADLLTCPWCLSVWVAAAVYGWWALHRPSWHVAAVIGLASAVTGLVRTNLRH